MEKRGSFSGKLGFILTAAGSAVGLGNLWRFPHLVAEQGGGIFLLVYLILVVTFGYSLMVAEIAIGRKTGLSPIGAFRKLGNKYTFIGVLATITVLLISTYYGVIGGWVVKYIAVYLTGQAEAAAGDAYFNNFIAEEFEPIIYLFIFILLNAVALIGGIKNGVERASKIMMPILLVLSIAIAIYSVTLPGAIEGVKYILIPDFSRFSADTIISAMGQMFYSMSLAMGIMITYGSYMSKKEDIESCVKHVELFDTSIAILAAFMIIPAIFSFSGGDPEQLNVGAGLMFVTLPKVFNSISGGTVIGALFFILVLFAALTSMISIVEVLVSTICDIFKWNRKAVVVVISVVILLAGIPYSLGHGIWSFIEIMGYNLLDFVDFIANNVLLPVTALSICLAVGFGFGVKVIADEVKLSSQFKREKVFNVMIKYIAPIFMIIILITNLI